MSQPFSLFWIAAVGILTVACAPRPTSKEVPALVPLSYAWKVDSGASWHLILGKHWDRTSPVGKAWQKDLNKIWGSRESADSVMQSWVVSQWKTLRPEFQVHLDSTGSCPSGVDFGPMMDQDLLWMGEGRFRSDFQHLQLRELQYSGKASQTIESQRYLEATVEFCLWDASARAWVTQGHATSRHIVGSVFSEVSTAYAVSRDVAGPSKYLMTEEIRGDWNPPLEKSVPAASKDWQELIQKLVRDVHLRLRPTQDLGTEANPVSNP
jgi:hypothetical protein